MAHKNYAAYPFVGIPTFLRAPMVREDEDLSDKEIAIGVIGAPFDEGCPYVPGSRLCARAVREQTLRFTDSGYYDQQRKRMYLGEELAKHRIYDFGDANVIPTDVEGSFDRITEGVKRILNQGALPIVLGGDHAISYPSIRAFDKFEGIHVLHLDAHTDFLPIEPGFENTNTHPFRHVNDMKHVKSLTQVGYRSIRDISGLDSMAAGNRVVTMDEFWELGPKGIAELLPEGEPCYVSIDIDVLDASLVPGCVSAEPDGMMYRELRDTLTAVAERMEVIGFDLVEVAPDLDVGTRITSYLAAQTIVEFLGKICDQPYWKEKHK